MGQNKSGRMMDNSGQGSDNGNKVLGYMKNNTPAQIWAIENTNDKNWIRIRNIQRNKCFDNSGTTRVGQYYHIWDCEGDNKNQWFQFTFQEGEVTPNMLWVFLPWAGGHLLMSKNGRMMDNDHQGSSNGNKVLGYRRNNTKAQIWVIESVDNGKSVLIRNVQRNKCFDDTGKPGNGRYYHIWDCSKTNLNQWITPKYPIVKPTVQEPVQPHDEPTPN